MPSTVSLPAIALSAASPADIDTDLLAVPVFEGDDMAADLRALDAATGGALMRAQESQELRGKLYELLITPVTSDWRPARLAFIGSGRRADFTTERLRRVAAAAALAARQRRVQRFAWLNRGDVPLLAAVQAATEGIALSAFSPDRYKSGERGAPPIDQALIVADSVDRPSEIEAAIERGRILGESSNIARELSNEPSNVLTALENERFDGVIIDLHMPGVSGLDVLKQVRVMEAGGQALTPFIVLSADATAVTVRACEQAGARAFLTKPIVVGRLLDALADVALGTSDSQIKPTQVVAEAQAAETVISRNVLEELAELHLGGDFLGLFLDECLRDALKSISELERTGAAAQWDLFRDHCHALKGVAGNMGAVQLAAAASDMMRLGNWQFPREWRHRIRGLREHLERARVALKAPVGTSEAERGPDRIS